jgi:hypothetical protein
MINARLVGKKECWNVKVDGVSFNCLAQSLVHGGRSAPSSKKPVEDLKSFIFITLYSSNAFLRALDDTLSLSNWSNI